MSEDNFDRVYVGVAPDEQSHIIVNEDIKALCGEKRIKEASQVDMQEDPVKKYGTETEEYKKLGLPMCEECKEKWSEIKYTLNKAPTETCFKCNNVVNLNDVAPVEHAKYGTVNACKSCYNKIYTHEDSAVTKTFEEAKNS